ncbi:uncharacterized protein EV154DRAFT_33372 [Mucor mucedo]|uniref:uncharacterized protein n=1 Tax=Mucor mucedo TaxID=29922 RepID=UPI00221FA725|nr:uncharacterized protein EV154DRAFT_33372 [Mucor mucedo]KAI7882309.1 hypothetical protein EV154DRAFT_33372 [Mucor mucedo]
MIFPKKCSIYSEKLKVLQNELASIENETHKVIVKQDKKLEKKRDKELKAANDMYEFQLQSIDKQVQHEKALVLQDIEQKADFANRVVTSEGTRKRKHKSPTAVTDSEDESEGEEVEFHRIHLKKKMGRLQAISDRQKATKFKKYHDDDVPNQEELQHDITMMRQKCA